MPNSPAQQRLVNYASDLNDAAALLDSLVGKGVLTPTEEGKVHPLTQQARHLAGQALDIASQEHSKHAVKALALIRQQHTPTPAEVKAVMADVAGGIGEVRSIDTDNDPQGQAILGLMSSAISLNLAIARAVGR